MTEDSASKKYPNKEEILSALKKSGYLFEQDVATEFESLGYHVDTNYAYNDSDTDKSREIDVRAIKQIYTNDEHNLQIYVEFLIECKNSNTPLVFIERNKNNREKNAPKPKEYIFPFSEYYKKSGPNSATRHHYFEYLDLKEKHYHYKTASKATQFAKIFRKGSDWLANHEGIYDSLILPLAKILEYRKKDAVKFRNNGHQKIIWLFFPAVVLKDQLYIFDTKLSANNITEEKRVSFVRDLDTSDIKGAYLVDFLTFDNIKHYVENDVEQFAKSISELVEESPDRIIKNQMD